jgi:hypothetical protein
MTVPTTALKSALKTVPKTGAPKSDPKAAPARTRRPRTEGTDTVTAPTRPAPAKKPAPAKTPTKTPPATRPAERSPGRSRSAAAQRAYARRAHREGRRVEPAETLEDQPTGRASFVILIIVLLTAGVAATLWLSTQAIADSYRLETAKQEATRLAEQAAELQREVTREESASALAERARAMGMVPAGDPARLVVQPDGSVVVVGEPTPVEPPQPPAEQNTEPPAGEEPPAAGGQQPGAG